MRNLIPTEDWVESHAEVTASEFEYTLLRDLSFDPPNGDQSRHRIAFSYKVESKIYCGHFHQYEALEEGSELPLFYNPAKPAENNLGEYPDTGTRRAFTLIVTTLAVLLTVCLAFRFD